MLPYFLMHRSSVYNDLFTPACIQRLSAILRWTDDGWRSSYPESVASMMKSSGASRFSTRYRSVSENSAAGDMVLSAHWALVVGGNWHRRVMLKASIQNRLRDIRGV